jgi:Phage portal protein, SPP1 Gp6-like
MPLPEGGAVPWPPEHCGPVNAQYRTWAAWYSGDAEQLAAIYTGSGDGQGHDTYGFFASQQGGFKAGVRKMAAAVRRWFWGAQTSATQQRTRLHVPLAGDIAAASADMLFSEPPTFTIPDAGDSGEPDPTQARLDQLIDDGTHATLLEAAETCAALGGVYLRVVWDPATRPDRPWLTAVHPDVAVPEWAWGKLVAVTFWRELARKGKLVVRHLERHEPGKIIHGVYEGTDDELGHPVPLTDHPETANLADERLVNGNEINTGAPGLTAVYVPNMRPNRLWRDNPHAAYLGRSDYAGTEPLMDALDLVKSSWVRDVDLGKARLIVPREYLQSNGRGQGASVDLDQEVYEPVNMMGSESGDSQITQVQFAIRVQEHAATADALKTEIVAAAGYSPQTFGLGEDGQAVTATEIAARNRRTLITRDRKTRYWIPGLRAIVETLLWVDKAQFGAGIDPRAPDVEFADAVSVDPLQVAQTLRELDTAGAISTEMKVRILHPDWDDTQVADEVERISSDKPPVEDPATFTGVGLDDDEY